MTSDLPQVCVIDFPKMDAEAAQRASMHLVVVRRDVYEGNRWIARSLFDAFVEAQALGRERLHQTTGLAVSLPWLEVELEETRRVFGDDPFPYGVAANRKVLEALLEYAHQQGLAARALSVEELFAPETLDT